LIDKAPAFAQGDNVVQFRQFSHNCFSCKIL
jgi:hypothetical protein